MGSLLNEYRNRNKLNFIWAATNGVCFFSRDKKPYAICLVSECQHAINRCRECSPLRKDKIIIEFIGFKRKYKIDTSHDHMPPDTNLNSLASHVGKYFGEKDDKACQPFVARSERDLETWLWMFFLQGTQPFRGTKWQKFRRGQKGGKGTKAVEQMMWAAINYPGLYKLYYDGFYSTYLLGRNYLLYR